MFQSIPCKKAELRQPNPSVQGGNFYGEHFN
jgi:hypothetical protein